MEYFHLYNMKFHGTSINEEWLHRVGWRKVFCPNCGSRRPGVSKVDIMIDSDSLDDVTGAFGYPNVGFVQVSLIDAVSFAAAEAFNFGEILTIQARPLTNVKTISTKTRRVPVRGFEPLEWELCFECGQPAIDGDPVGKRYIVSRRPLTEPLYESSDNQIIIREDLLDRVRPFLNPRILIEHLPVEPIGHDGRTEVDLEF
jgi:hypothetical protein